MPSPESHENPYATFEIRDGILFFEYKKDAFIDLEAAIEIVDHRIQLQKSQPYPVLCDITKVKSFDKQARTYLANEGSQLVSAVALIVGSPARKHMSNFYLTVNKPAVPTRVFTSREEALMYLKELLTAHPDIN